MKIPEQLRLRLRTWAYKKMQTPPDFIIRPYGKDQVLRWHILPRNRFFNIYLHRFLLSDDDRALHDHPWPNASILIEGSYWEYSLHKTFVEKYKRHQGCIYFREPSQAHRIELIPVLRFESLLEDYSSIARPAGYAPVTTLFITGPKVREWGFLCPRGWRHWKEFCDTKDSGVIGKGCD